MIACLTTRRIQSVLLAGPDAGGELPRLKLNVLALLAGRGLARTASVPAAYLWVGLYSKDSVLLGERRSYLQDSVPASDWQKLFAKMYADSAGYVRVELRDESQEAAYFDDLLLRIVKANALQQNHYDPFGLNLVGIETRPADKVELHQYNGKERVEDYGLEWNFHDARTLDKQLGRWWQVDPMAGERANWSPCQFGRNNPVLNSDPLGALDAPYVDESGRYLGNDRNDADHEVRVISAEAWSKVSDPKSAEGTKELVANSTQLVEYGKGINISDATWNALVSGGASFHSPALFNDSKYVVNFKPEGNIGKYKDEGSYPVALCSNLYMGIDGVAVPDIRQNSVYKVVDGQQTVVNDVGVSTFTTITPSLVGTFLSTAYSLLRTGWKTEAPAVNWNNLYSSSVRK